MEDELRGTDRWRRAVIWLLLVLALVMVGMSVSSPDATARNLPELLSHALGRTLPAPI